MNNFKKFALMGLATASIVALPTESSADSIKMKVINTSQLNIRSIQNQQNIIEKIKGGTVVEVIEKMKNQPGWYYVKTPSGKRGVCSGAYLSSVNNQSVNTVTNNSVYYTKERLNIRTGPGTSYSVIKTLNKGTKVEKISESNGWAKIKYEGQIRYCSASYLSKGNVQSTATNASNTLNTKVYYVKSSVLNVRNKPTTNGSVVIKKLSKNDKVDVVEFGSNGWAKIRISGKDYYVSNLYLSSTNQSSNSNSKTHSYSFSTSLLKTSYKSRQNITNAFSKINGTIVMPGQIFSYLNSVGPITTTNGYVTSKSISGGVYIDSVGGGICQGSTTLHNAVVKAGLTVVERRNHSLPSAYVSKGTDAMVASGDGYKLDYRFKNTSKYPIKIVAYTKDDKAVVELQCANDITGGYEYKSYVDISSDGLRSTTTVWKMKDGKKIQKHQTFYSTYKKA